MSLLRKQLIADINNSLIENSKEEKLVANNTNIDKIFNYFDLSSKKIKIQVSNGYTYYIIQKKDLEDIKDQINNGIHDKKLLEFYKNDKKNICNKQHNNEYITIYKDTSILQMA